MNLPEAGDIHWADFGETLGTEQAGLPSSVGNFRACL